MSTPAPSDDQFLEPPRQEPVSSVVLAPGGLAQQRSAELAEVLEAQVAELGIPGAQAAMVFGDGSVWSAGAGLAADEHPMRPDHLLAVASVSKVYTAALVSTLAEDGVLSLDDPLTRWVPGSAAGVTIRQLLTHTSGLASDDVALRPVCEPGACFSYSNGGYDLLGRIVEAADGGSFAASLRRRVLIPLRLTATFSTAEEQTDGESATGYQAGRSAKATELAPPGEGLGWRAASGGLVATAADGARFMQGVFEGLLMTPDSLGQLLDVEHSIWRVDGHRWSPC